MLEAVISLIMGSCESTFIHVMHTNKINRKKKKKKKKKKESLILTQFKF